MIRKISIFLIVVAALLVLVPSLVALADAGGPPEVVGVPSSEVANLIAMVAGTVLSLIFSYAPWLAGWYGNLAPDYKRTIMVLALVIVTAGIYGLNCWQIIDVDMECNVDGALQAVTALLLALVANQATHQISPKLR